jgi:hypothetical protein
MVGWAVDWPGLSQIVRGWEAVAEEGGGRSRSVARVRVTSGGPVYTIIQNKTVKTFMKVVFVFYLIF